MDTVCPGFGKKKGNCKNKLYRSEDLCFSCAGQRIQSGDLKAIRDTLRKIEEHEPGAIRKYGLKNVEEY